MLVRAFRRQKELLEKNDLVDIDEIVDNLTKRDQIDSTRKESPLIKADKAISIDTTHITIDEQVDEVIRLALTKMIPTVKSND
jgi:cytidylate kinase